MENSKTWDKSFCNKVIESFCSNDIMENFHNNNRKYKRNLLYEKDKKNSWVWESVNNLIKVNLGDNHYLSTWLIGLRYDEGDYFLEHKDGYGTGDRYLSGGIELSAEDEYEGGIYTIEGKNKRYNQGVLFVHSPFMVHEITKVTKGTRYSLHFCVSKEKSDLI